MPREMNDRVTTSQLLTMLCDADSFEEALSIHDSVQEISFPELLYRMMAERNLSPKDMILLTGIDRSYFYHLLNGNKNPGRNMVLRIGLCLRLSLTKMNQLLRQAGLGSLYSKRRRDAVIIYAVSNRLSMAKANELLLQAGEEPLYWETRYE